LPFSFDIFIVIILNWEWFLVKYIISSHFKRIRFTLRFVMKHNSVIFVGIHILLLLFFKKGNSFLLLHFVKVLLVRNKVILEFVLERIIQLVVQLFIGIVMCLLFYFIITFLFLTIIFFRLLETVYPFSLKVFGKGIWGEPFVRKVSAGRTLRDQIVVHSERKRSKITSVGSIHFIVNKLNSF
jgi:hypothetical protein